MINKHFFCLLFFLGYWFCGVAQSNINIKFFGFNLHPKGDINAPLMPLNLDNKGYFVITLGGTVGFEKFIKENKFSLKAIQAVYSDCAVQFAGFTHVGVRWVIFKKGKHSMNGGIGPTFLYRRNWNRLEGYINSGYFKGQPNDFWQYKFIPYAGELEYNVVLNPNYELSTTLIPGYPNLISLSLGLRCWLRPMQK